MNIYKHASIFRFQDGTKDKVWVICPGLGNHDEDLTFWGRTNWDGEKTAQLQSKSVPGDINKRIDSKFAKGYQLWPDVKFDLDSNRVISLNSVLSEPKFYYRFDSTISPDQLSALMGTISERLEEFESDIAMPGLMVDLEAFFNVNNNGTTGSIPYKIGPIGPLVLYACRKKFGNGFKVSDDDNRMLPDTFKDLGNYLFSESLLALTASAPWTPELFRELGYLFECIERPINLSNIDARQPAAFF